MNTTVIARFASRDEPAQVVADLIRAGTVTPQDVTVIHLDRSPAYDPLADADRAQLLNDIVEVGVLGGVIIGGLVSIALSLGIVAYPGVSIDFAAEPVLTGLGGAIIGGLFGIAGGFLLGGLAALSTNNAVAHAYGEDAAPKDTLVGVVVPSDAAGRVEEVFEQHGALRIVERHGTWRRRRPKAAPRGITN
ncbi:MAG: hypothetical protein DIU80_022720 [Chloroflexota bacterium]|nr:MAG: hypothetical protein DIU80_20200 [Chloroflexota bacterium]